MTTLARVLFCALLAVSLAAQSADRLVGKNVSIAKTNYKGRSAIQVIAKPDAANATSYALVKDASFRDGVIEVDLAGQPAATSTFICGPQMVEPTIKSGAITPRNIVRIPILTSLDHGRRLPKDMSPTSIWSLAPGPNTRSK